MVRPIDPFWDKVDEMIDGVMSCKFCGQLFAPTTSISRIKWHFSGEKGHGVSICSRVPIHVREEAFGAMCGDKKRHKSTASSSSINDVAISTPPREPNNEVENLGGDIGRVQTYVKSMEGRVWGEETSSEAGDDVMNMTGLRAVGEGIQEFMHSMPLEDMKLNDEGRVPDGVVLDDHLGLFFDLVSGVNNLAGNHMDSVVNDRSITLETGRDALQATDQVGQVDIENTDWAAIASIAQFIDGTGGFMRPVAGADSSVQLSCNTSESRGDASTTCSTKLMGQEFEENKNAILSWLTNDEATLIGVYGMGGVGKTSLVKHIYNQLKQRSDTCHHIYWTSVSQDFSIYKLQKQIANQLDLDLSNEDDEMQRAQQLSEALMMKHKPIIILDNLWNYFDSEKVGIPMQKKGCKLIFTTQSLEVCETMGCMFKIQVRPLCLKEAWTLFMEQFMHDRVISPEVEQIAKCVAKDCAGLPLAIVTTARSMRGVDDIHEWRDVLRKLKESEVKNIEPDVFQILRLSYERLDDVDLKQCFLYCALFPKDYLILRDDFIGYLIDEGIIEGMGSRQAEFDKGHAMLNKLENVCLLESCSDFLDDRAVKMHDLIRDLALGILMTNSQVMVKAGSPLNELPKEWNENLIRVSLIQTHINEIPWSHSPRCPSLSTLLLSNNQELKFIPDSFFKRVDGLKVLDLACTKIETLPDSISDLVTLSALLLRSCWKLKHVPSLKKLVELRRLDLRDTALENVPQGMIWLSKLRDLRLSLCGQVEFPIGVLPKLSRLQIFELEELLWDDAYFPVTVKGKEVGCLRKLETLKCHFENLSDLADYLKSRDETQLLNSYSFVVGRWDKIDYETVKAYHKFSTVYPHKGTVVLSNLNISRGRRLQVMFPNNIKQLMICSCDDATSFCDFFSLIKNTTELEVLYIRDCNSIERLLSSSWIHSATYETPSSLSIFSCLKEFNCYNCKSMKKLFPLALLPNLKNLEVICVKFCYKLEEIIASTVEDEEQDAVEDSRSYSITESNFLPNLRSLELDFLPELRSICSAKLACNSLKQISVYNCPKLKRMPFSLPLLDNGQPFPPTSLKRVLIDKKEWWESVEWDHPNAKDVLLPFVSYLWD